MDLDMSNETLVRGPDLVFEIEKLAWAPELEDVGLIKDLD
jgi:hypothetical protein